MSLDQTFDTPGPVLLHVELGAGSLSVEIVETTTATVSLTGSGADETVVERREDALVVLAPRTTGFLTRQHVVHARITVPSRSTLQVRTGSADIRVTGDPVSTRVESGSGQITIDDVGSDAVVSGGSGDIRIQHSRGRLEVQSGSGDIVVTAAEGDLLAKTGSGDIVAERVIGSTVLRSGSGDARIASSGSSVQAKTGSGSVEVGLGGGDISVTTASGDLVISEIGTGSVTARTASGSVRCRVAAGTPVWTDVSTVSGRIHSELDKLGEPAEGQPYVEIRATTVSGAIDLRHH